MSLPAAYQSDAPFGANVGGVAAGFIAAVPTTAFDSWLALHGLTAGDTRLVIHQGKYKLLLL